MSKQTVYVGMSGGVDSSVAALRLQRAGYQVVGVFIKVWHPDFLVCNWETERRDAMRVAAALDIPFLTCDAESAYYEQVARSFIAEYQAGRTPNPDVLCNKHVKFGAFLDFATKQEADYIATGHYARSLFNQTTQQYQLVRGIDEDKDQSYFLWTLTNEQLARVLLPLGDTKKADIRQEASDAGLPTAAKADSQGICFLGHVDIPEFLRHYMTLTPGAVLDTSGTKIGTHTSAIVYTIGQRHGFTVTDPAYSGIPLYVVERDIEANTITVAPEPRHSSTDDTLELQATNFTTPVAVGDHVAAQTRYRQSPFPVQITAIGNGSVTLKPTTPVASTASGQSCVLYDGEICLGGGIIR